MNNWSSDLVSIVIVSYKKPELLSHALSSINAQTYSRIEKIAVLNCFNDEEIAAMRRRFADIQIIANKENLFYARALNQGIRRSQGEFVLCLNDDLVLEANFVYEMLRAAKQDETIGMVNGYILRQTGNIVDSTGLFLGWSRRPVERGYGRKRGNVHSKDEYIFGSGGVAPLYRREMLEDIKINDEYFDEDYGMFYEDLDLSWRAQNRRWRGYHACAALAYHCRGASSKQQKPSLRLLQRYNFPWLSQELKISLLKNRYATIIKNDSLAQFLLHLPWILLYELKVWGYLLLYEREVAKNAFKDSSFFKQAWAKRNKLKNIPNRC
ncbi:MAG: glycosyltransferase family 2 protein [Candidatus Omnitrophota bacterium]